MSGVNFLLESIPGLTCGFMLNVFEVGNFSSMAASVGQPSFSLSFSAAVNIKQNSNSK